RRRSRHPGARRRGGDRRPPALDVLPPGPPRPHLRWAGRGAQDGGRAAHPGEARAHGHRPIARLRTVSRAMDDSIAEHMTEDHVRLDGVLAAATRCDPVNLDAYAEFRAGLLRHIAIEKKILLPPADRA